MQCMASAMIAGTAATGLRAVAAARARIWLTPPRLKALTVALLTAAVLLAAGLHT